MKNQFGFLFSSPLTKYWSVVVVKIRLFERQGYRKEEMEKQGEGFHLPVHSPNDCYSQDRASVTWGTKGFFQTSHVGAGAWGPEPSSATFPGVLAAGLEGESLELKTSAHVEDHNCWSQFTRLCHNTSPGILSCEIGVFTLSLTHNTPLWCSMLLLLLCQCHRKWKVWQDHKETLIGVWFEHIILILTFHVCWTGFLLQILCIQ